MENTEKLVSEMLVDAARHAPGPIGFKAQRQPQTRARWRQWGAPLAVGLAAASILVGVAVAWNPQDEKPLRPATTPEPDTGMVGFGSLAIARPTGWSVNDVKCGAPQSDTVIVQPSDAVLACAQIRPIGVSDIVLDDLDSATARRWSEIATTSVQLNDGTQALVGSVLSIYKGYSTTVIVAEGLDAIAVGTSPTNVDLNEQLMTLTTAPEGSSPIPQLVGLRWDEAKDALDALGLVATRELRNSPNHSEVVDTAPPAATMVRQGTVVTVYIGN